MDIQFIDPVLAVIEEVERISGKGIEFIQKDDIPGYVKRDALKILSFWAGGCDKNSPMLRLAPREAPGGFHHIMVRG